jgi:hypothetical protein
MLAEVGHQDEVMSDKDHQRELMIEEDHQMIYQRKVVWMN